MNPRLFLFVANFLYLVYNDHGLTNEVRMAKVYDLSKERQARARLVIVHNKRERAKIRKKPKGIRKQRNRERRKKKSD